MSNYPEVSRLLIDNTHYDIKDATARNYIGTILQDLRATTINNISLIGHAFTSHTLGIQSSIDEIQDTDIDQIFYLVKIIPTLKLPPDINMQFTYFLLQMQTHLLVVGMALPT